VINVAEVQRKKLIELEGEISELKVEMDRLSDEARRFVEKRNSIHEKIRELRLEATKLKVERDALNDEVKNLKIILGELNESYHEKLNNLNGLRQKIREHIKIKPAESEENLKREISEIEWKIQTSSLMLEEENKLVKRVKSLETRLAFYSKLKEMRSEATNLREQIKKLKDEIASCRSKIAEDAAKSQKLHERMMEHFREIDKLKAEADEMHKIYLETREKISSLRLKYADLLSQISSLKKIIREEEEKKRIEATAAIKRKIESEALEKLKRGEKISFEEFKILAEQGKI
jgi:phosphoserine phosphatase